MMRSSVGIVVGTVTAIESAAADADAPIYTYIHLQPERVIKGPFGREPIVLRELGGTVGDRREWVFGAPEFWVGERALVFLSRNPDGTVQTHSLAMGKFTLSVDTAGHPTAVRDFGYGGMVLNPETGLLVEAQPETQPLDSMVNRLQVLAQAEPPSSVPFVKIAPPNLAQSVTQVTEAFTFLGSPSRWFEPDSGQPVSYLIDSGGDRTLGATVSRAAVDAALAAWTNVTTSSLILTDGGTTAPGSFSGCTFNRVLFNDPSGEVSDPSGCSGILAIGGFCTSSGTTTVNGTVFGHIVIGKVMFNNGWGGCSFWNQCNVGEVATHEIGHTIGLGHSADSTATMAAVAHFDGRCARLMSDDVAAATFIYPQVGTPVPTPTFTLVLPSTPTPTRTPTRAPTFTLAPATATFTRTPVSTATPTFTRPSATPTFTRPSATPTATRPPATATATRGALTPTPTFGRSGALLPTKTPTRRL